MRKIVATSLVVVLTLVIITAIVIASGAYNVAADEEHTAFGHWLLETARERSIAARTDDVAIPNLDAERIRRGAGNYDAMCVNCHLAPGVGPTELSQGLYPRPPNLTKAVQGDPARTFWIIKHGLKATGMPAWGKSMEDSYVWDLVAFIQKLPQMSPQHYAAEVAASGGHSHGGGEDTAGGHDEDLRSDQQKLTDPPAAEHTHADGESHTH